MNAAHQGFSVAELIDAEKAAVSKWNPEMAAEHEFVGPVVQDIAHCGCGEEIFPADDECTSCLHGSVSQAAAERANDATENRFEDR